MKRVRWAALGAVLVAACAAAAAVAAFSSNGDAAVAAGSCQLGTKAGQVKHVIYLQFDNTHYRRDNTSVASDLEQMPHLLSFLQGNGTLLTNDHTVLISHTAGGILSSLTGLYPDRNGQTVSNSYDYFKQNGAPAFTSSFKYWTDPVASPAASGVSDNPLPNMVSDGGQTTPAPWLTFTHAGCDVGGVSAANIELENTSTAANGDISKVFGNPSPEATEASTNPSLAQTDFVGIAIHCALGSTLCQPANNPKNDDSTIVPGSNDGYQALFGAKYVNPAIGGSGLHNGCVKATDGTNITDSAGNCGFPGFDAALAKNTLGEVAQMQEHGVPVTFAYISDAHDNHATGTAFGPGEAGYQAQLKAYDDAFATFFMRLQADGITKDNSLFVVTVDEGDHFAGGVGSPDPANPGALTYSHTPCATLTACPANQIGEVTANIKGILPAGQPPFDIHFDSAPTFYVNGQPTRNDPVLRKLEQNVGAATATDPYASGGQAVPIAQQLADTVEEQTLHMVNSDPKRTPSFTMFGNPDFYFQTFNPSACGAGVNPCVDPKFAWNHGDVQDEIGNTWLGMVGPGVQRLGINDKVWTDHTDIRPTMLSLLGLADSYQNDGRVITQIVSEKAQPKGLDQHEGERLGDAYKQVNAPFGQFALDTLKASTVAIKATDPLKYESIESQIANLTSERDTLAHAIRYGLNQAEFAGNSLDENQVRSWLTQAQSLLDRAHQLSLVS